MIESRGLTLIGLSVGNLDDDGAVQLTLPFDRFAGGALDRAVDLVRERFGSGAITRTLFVGQDDGEPMPMLPD
jgi:DNA polymerase-4